MCHDAGKEAEGKNSGIQFQEICYLSSNFFANQIGAAFEELGYEVTVCELSKEDDLDAKLARYIGQPYRLILDFNSLLPRMVLDDGTPYVDRLAGPFFDYILDHPLFHYRGTFKRCEKSACDCPRRGTAEVRRKIL